MFCEIKKLTNEKRALVVEMMQEFYISPAVSTNGSNQIFNLDIDACISNSPYLEGYVFEKNNQICGYTRLCKKFFNRICKALYLD